MAGDKDNFRDPSAQSAAELEIDTLFSLSLDLLCIAGTDGFFKRVNPAFERVLGYSSEELLKRSFLELVHPDDRADTLREVENLAQGRLVVDFKNRYLAKDGTWRWLSWRSAPMAEKGLIYAVARDITEEKQREELIARQTRELERSNADLERFASVASHDLRAPLRQIATLAKWIEEEMPGEVPQGIKGYLAELHARVRRLDRMTANLLAYARASRTSLETSRVDTAAMVRDVTALLGPPEGIVVRVEPKMPVLVTTRVPLEQIFRNLIGNAIKHHGYPKGSVIVSARDLGQFHEFSVADDGPGIPIEAHRKIFEMFQTLGSGDSLGGNGIGLALVKRIVEGQGGEVWVESEEGGGATFRFTWPKRLPAGASA